MRNIKLLLAAAFLTVSTSAFSQNNSGVLLKWKLKPNEVISYKTIMSDVDTNSKAFDFSGMMKAMGADSSGLTDVDAKMKQFAAAMKPSAMVTRLTEKRKGIVDIEMVAKNDHNPFASGTDSTGMQEVFKRMFTGVILRGSIYEDGTIASFYTKAEQKNILALFFELPGKSIKQGDSWPLSVNLATVDQNFRCDSAYRKNKVTAVKIENINGDKVVTLQYDIVEYLKGDFNMPSPMGNSSNIPTTMKMTFQGLASFSVEKGRWLSYNGVISLNSTGFMTASSKQNYALVEEK